jgi:hypothetical protein
MVLETGKSKSMVPALDEVFLLCHPMAEGGRASVSENKPAKGAGLNF